MARKKVAETTNNSEELEVTTTEAYDGELSPTDEYLNNEVGDDELPIQADETTDDEFDYNSQPDTHLMLQVSNHGRRYWDAINNLWIEEGQNFLTLEDENKKERLVSALTQLNMLAGYDRFEMVVG